jgi:transcriptional regulator with PAS, ATPase and Fis domain
METQTTTKSLRMQLLEHEYGKPIEQIIGDLYDELGSHDAVAQRLGINRISLLEWRQRLGIRTRRVSPPRYTVVR